MCRTLSQDAKYLLLCVVVQRLRSAALNGTKAFPMRDSKVFKPFLPLNQDGASQDSAGPTLALSSGGGWGVGSGTMGQADPSVTMTLDPTDRG